jgi:hypothetical protein
LLTLATDSQRQLGQADFYYPLTCVFEIIRTERKTNTTVVIYHRNILVQTASAMNDALELHLSILGQYRGYRLTATSDRPSWK